MFRRRIISISIFCLYLAAVAYLCFAKTEDMPQIPDTWFGLPADKVAHFAMFLPFPLLGFLAFKGSGTSIWKKTLLIIALIFIGAAVAICTEHIQTQLAYRSAETTDLIADGAGLFCGGVAAFIYTFIRYRK